MSNVKDTNWRSYNEVAEVYARVAEVHYFAGPARDLLALVDPAPGSRFLDAGAGSGAAQFQRATESLVLCGDCSWPDVESSLLPSRKGECV